MSLIINITIDKMKHTIKNLSHDNLFIIEMKISPIGKEKEKFKFSNSMYLLEKNLLKIMDNKENTLYPDTIISIRPREIKTTETIISKDTPFIYLIKGKIENEGDYKRISLPSVQYLLKKGEEYLVELNNNDIISNRIILKI